MINVGQFCINVEDLERSVKFYSEVMGLSVEQRIEIPGTIEAVLVGDNGVSKIQLAQQLENPGPIRQDNGFWKLYLDTDDCHALYQRALDAGAQSMMEPMVLDEWNVTIAFVIDPDGYTVELMQQHG